MWMQDSQSIALRGFWQDAKWKIIIHFSETRGRKSNHVEECVMAPTRLQDKKTKTIAFAVDMSMWIRDSQSIALRGFWQDAKWKIIIHFSETRGRKSNHVEECVMAPTRLQDKKKKPLTFAVDMSMWIRDSQSIALRGFLARCEMENNHSFLGNEREKEQSC
ncbi:hypothetical protein CEXT_197671 [Caerostris extrusa]|uniref:Uncharacterized protein n=1 Tax=Caerostris extrusa TaxID=172846 RepID=A0AAV4XR82_CAEEX|nr:hypothetical protein CEXT_197671 [Caerostris extrusa]